MTKEVQKIYKVYVLSEFKGYVVSATDELAMYKASKTMGVPEATIEVEDTKTTKNRCCGKK